MALTVQRDPSELRAGLERWLGRPVGDLTRAAPGFTCETVIVDHELVVRLPPLGEGIFPVYDLEREAAVQNAVGSGGVPVAAPVRYVEDPSFLGAPFVAMAFVDGAVPTEFPPADPWLAGLDDALRRTVWRALLQAVVAIHAVPLDGPLGQAGLRSGLDAELDHWEGYLAWATDGAPPPPLAQALAWCRDNRPSRPAPDGLLWGDVRPGNVVFDRHTGAPLAVLDWDMTSCGPIEMDVGWHLALESVQTGLTGMSVPGFGTQEETLALVESGIGRTLEDMGWFEIFALVRASAISTRIAVLFDRAGQRSPFKVGRDPTLAAAVRRIEAC